MFLIGLFTRFAPLLISLLVLPLAMAQAEEQVRVRLFKELRRIRVNAQEAWNVETDKTKKSQLLLKKGKYSIQAKRIEGGNLLWTLTSKQNDLIYLKGGQLRIRGPKLELENLPMPENLLLYPKTASLLPESPAVMDVVGSIEIENYLATVIPAEMPGSWHEEALKAQAIVTRSYTYSLLKESAQAGRLFDLEASVADQVFRIMSPQELPNELREKIKSIVRTTRGTIIATPKGKLTRAYYHADCGGHTEEPAHVWANGMRFGTVKDRGCPLSPTAQWHYTIDRRELEKRLKDFLHLENSKGSLSAIQVAANTFSGRAHTLSFVLGGRSYKIGAHQFRQLLGVNQIKSTLFSLKASSAAIKVVGRGHGHGVGMCQWGAQYLARTGASYSQIVNHYYSRMQLGRMNRGFIALEPRPLPLVRNWPAPLLALLDP